MKIINYNVYGHINKHINVRKIEIVNQIFKNGIPDIICLQEATDPIINLILKKYKYYICSKPNDYVTKFKPEQNNVYLKNQLEQGYLIILSKYKILKQNIIYFENEFGEGIIHIQININNKLINIFNYHATGGTFGQTEKAIEFKINKRINEVKILNKLIKENIDNSLIMGDFNTDSNQQNIYNEINYHPEYIFPQIIDLWSKLKKNKPGYTEDEIINLYRSSLKIKPEPEKRQARYDKILYNSSSFISKDIELIGTKNFGENIDIVGQDKYGTKIITTNKLFPSDHFGLYGKVELL